MKQPLSMPLIILFGCWLASTSARAQTDTFRAPPLPTLSFNITNRTHAISTNSLIWYVPDDKYKLRPGDKVSYQVIEDREDPKVLVVADNGELDIPYLGRVTAAGKTCKQLCEEVKAQLEQELYYRATVIIALESANKWLGRVYVWGQVRNQGALDMLVQENLTAGKAILRAGGFSDFANKKKVKVIRANAPPGQKIVELNMVEILEQGKTEKDITLEPDDIVVVPSRLINL